MKIFAFEKSVGAVVFRKEGGGIVYLLLKYRSGQWDFPKGHVEEGETEKETLFREVMEETGLTELELIEGFRTVNRFFYTAKGNEHRERIERGVGVSIFKRVVYYVLKTEKIDIVLNFENKKYAWLNYDECLKRIRNSGSRNTIEKVDNFLKTKGF